MNLRNQKSYSLLPGDTRVTKQHSKEIKMLSDKRSESVQLMFSFSILHSFLFLLLFPPPHLVFCLFVCLLVSLKQQTIYWLNQDETKSLEERLKSLIWICAAVRTFRITSWMIFRTCEAKNESMCCEWKVEFTYVINKCRKIRVRKIH